MEAADVEGNPMKRVKNIKSTAKLLKNARIVTELSYV